MAYRFGGNRGFRSQGFGHRERTTRTLSAPHSIITRVPKRRFFTQASSHGSSLYGFLMVGALGVTSALVYNDKEKEKEIEEFPGTISHFPDIYQLPIQKLKVPTDPNRKPLILVACGSFSPITVMHLRLLEMAKDYFNSNGFEVIGGYLSPVADAYQKKGLVGAIDRTNMAILACEDSEWIMVDTWEPSKPKWTPTVEVLTHFHKEVHNICNQDVNVIFVCGSDLLDSFNVPGLWSDVDVQKICDFGLAVITREGSDPSFAIWKNDLLYANRTQIHKIHQWIPNDISSTLVRLGISRDLSIKYLLPDNVLHYIKSRGLYRNL